MTLESLPPSVFSAFPFGSITDSHECEQVARNIMTIRKRLGDVWPLTWRQYRKERKTDIAAKEREQFKQVMLLIATPALSMEFCPDWAVAARSAMAVPVPLAWTSEHPSEDGFYWVRTHGAEPVVAHWTARFKRFATCGFECVGLTEDFQATQAFEFWPERIKFTNKLHG